MFLLSHYHILINKSCYNDYVLLKKQKLFFILILWTIIIEDLVRGTIWLQHHWRSRNKNEFYFIMWMHEKSTFGVATILYKMAEIHFEMFSCNFWRNFIGRLFHTLSNVSHNSSFIPVQIIQTSSATSSAGTWVYLSSSFVPRSKF